MYINDIPNSVKCTPRLFADDTCLLVEAPSITILENQLKDDLNNICNWISANNLTLNSKKSQLLIIAPNLKFSNVVSIFKVQPVKLKLFLRQNIWEFYLITD